MDRVDIKYIGGVERFDLWARWDMNELNEFVVTPTLRIHVVGGRMNEWDIFELPMRDNLEIDTSQAPDQRRLRGTWGDVLITFAEADLIDTYLRCFAPWVLGSNLTEESNDV
jgi:hypothetical protein